MSNANSSPSTVRIGMILLVLAGLGVGAWFLFKPKDETDNVNWNAVYSANNRGIGHMERFEYEEAAKAFEEVIQLAPKWYPGQINRAIALLNFAGGINPDHPELGSKRKPLFQEALQLLLAMIADSEASELYKTYAHYNSGIIYKQFGNWDKLKEHMEQVTKLDPKDPYGWYYLAIALDAQNADPEETAKYLEKAVHGAPFARQILYAYLGNPYIKRKYPEKQREMLKRGEELRRGDVLYDAVKERYTEMGFYGSVIGHQPPQAPETLDPLPMFLPDDNAKIQLADGAKWATEEDRKQLPNVELHDYLLNRFGAVMVALDFNKDMKLDLFLLNAVIEDGKIRHLLLRNDGNFQFIDVTRQAGLHTQSANLGCSVADFTNDGYADLLLTGVNGVTLMHNQSDATFVDVTEKAGLPKENIVTLAACWVDLDQDGDLDFLVSQIADTAETALQALKTGNPTNQSRVALYMNTSIPIAKVPSEDPPPLKPSFKKSDHPEFQKQRLVTTMAITDLDLDYDVDLVLLSANGKPEWIENDRLLKLQSADWPEQWVGKASWNGAVSLAATHDDRWDLFLISQNETPTLMIHEQRPGEAKSLSEWWKKGTIKSPALRQAQAIDMNLDGWTDIVGVSSEGQSVVLLNHGGKLINKVDGLGGQSNWGENLHALLAGDFNCDGTPELFGWSALKGLLFRNNRGNGNHGLVIHLDGHRRAEPEGEIVRCNVDGIGTVAMIHSAAHWAAQEYTTLSAGLGQSSQPLLFGLAKHSKAEVLRLRWPDIVWQAEHNLETGRCVKIDEKNRKTSSCPIFFAWNGQRFEFITDFLGAGTVAELNPDGTPRPPRPEESIKIESHQLKPKDDSYIFKFAEPMNEATYLDRLQLLVLDVPANVGVYPDERFATVDPQPTQELLAYDKQYFPSSATNHRKQDVTQKLKKWDRDSVDQFAWRSWLGFAEDHYVEMDFGEQLKSLDKDQRLVLFLSGHTEYAYPESIWAATQADFSIIAPQLEQQDAKGNWQPIAEIGFPAGMARMMTFDVTGKLNLKDSPLRLRIRTNLQVFWDQIFLAPVKDNLFKKTTLNVNQAKLYPRGCMLEHSPDGKLPMVYDYHRLDPFPYIAPSGRYTRFGDVKTLLTQRDDCFVIYGPGDEIEVRFDASQLSKLPEGWTRSFVLKTWGYCKGPAPFTKGGEKLEPLPFHGMSNYPYPKFEKYPDDEKHREYLRKYQTRQVGEK